MRNVSYCFGVDYDGTIADTNWMKARWIREHLHKQVDPWQCDHTNCVPLIGAESYESMANTVYERTCSLAAPPVAGALAGLQALRRLGKVYVLTARLPHRLAFAREWLERQGAPELGDALLSSAESDKLSVCQRHGINVLIDDDERHLLPLLQSGIRGILLKVGFGGTLSLPAGVQLCRAWPDVLTVL
jgi:hypothetical protein